MSFSLIRRKACSGSMMTLSKGIKSKRGTLSCPGIVQRPFEKALSTSSSDLALNTSLVAKSFFWAVHQMQNPSKAEALFKPITMAMNFQSPDRNRTMGMWTSRKHLVFLVSRKKEEKIPILASINADARCLGRSKILKKVTKLLIEGVIILVSLPQRQCVVVVGRNTQRTRIQNGERD